MCLLATLTGFFPEIFKARKILEKKRVFWMYLNQFPKVLECVLVKVCTWYVTVQFSANTYLLVCHMLLTTFVFQCLVRDDVGTVTVQFVLIQWSLKIGNVVFECCWEVLEFCFQNSGDLYCMQFISYLIHIQPFCALAVWCPGNATIRRPSLNDWTGRLKMQDWKMRDQWGTT